MITHSGDEMIIGLFNSNKTLFTVRYKFSAKQKFEYVNNCNVGLGCTLFTCRTLQTSKVKAPWLDP